MEKPTALQFPTTKLGKALEGQGCVVTGGGKRRWTKPWKRHPQASTTKANPADLGQPPALEDVGGWASSGMPWKRLMVPMCPTPKKALRSTFQPWKRLWKRPEQGMKSCKKGAETPVLRRFQQQWGSEKAQAHQREVHPRQESLGKGLEATSKRPELQEDSGAQGKSGTSMDHKAGCLRALEKAKACKLPLPSAYSVQPPAAKALEKAKRNRMTAWKRQQVQV